MTTQRPTLSQVDLELQKLFPAPATVVVGPANRTTITFRVTSGGGGDDDCLTLLVNLQPPRSTSIDGEDRPPRPTILVKDLARCGCYSGVALLRKLDELAVRIGAQTILLEDASRKLFRVVEDDSDDDDDDVSDDDDSDNDGTCSISLSRFMILATGQSWYNAFGYRSSSHDADVKHNAAVLAAPLPANIEMDDDTVRTPTTPATTIKEVFKRILDTGFLRRKRSCSDPLVKWVVAAMDALEDRIQYNTSLVKAFPLPPSPPQKPNRGGRGAARSERRRTRRRRLRRFGTPRRHHV